MWFRSKRKQRMAIELLLLSRLKILGIILCGFGCGFLLYALNTPALEQLTGTLTLPEEELSGVSIEGSCPPYSFNFFSLASLFGALGISCLILSWKKTRSIHRKK